MSAAAMWARWRWPVIAAGALLAGLLGYVAHRESTAVWRERAHVADSTAKAEQRNRARVERVAASAMGRADSLAAAALRFERAADSAAQQARSALARAERANVSRDAAITSLRASATQGDSLTALLRKSAADDSVIAAQRAVSGNRDSESVALRQAIDSGRIARSVLAAALDSARAQLARDGRVIQQLQSVIRTARPTSAPRLTKLALAVGVGGCATPDLVVRPCVGVIAGPAVRLF